MASEGKPKEGSSATILALAGVIGLGALGLVYYFHDQAAKAETLLLRSKDDYRQMQERMKKPVEEWIRQKGRTPPKEDTGDMLTFLDRKAREAQIPTGTYTISRNAPAVVG